MTGTTRRLPAWEPEPLPLQIPAPTDQRTRRSPADIRDDGEEREAERETPAGSHVVVIDIG
ncbi:MAG TPA: hypothetical protein VL463_01050 [Kofleriaceae bacterium]|jgi:hypothetical protein|nr:hypothetical protein [Kofleriaceae bacterium]